MLDLPCHRSKSGSLPLPGNRDWKPSLQPLQGGFLICCPAPPAYSGGTRPQTSLQLHGGRSRRTRQHTPTTWALQSETHHMRPRRSESWHAACVWGQAWGLKKNGLEGLNRRRPHRSPDGAHFGDQPPTDFFPIPVGMGLRRAPADNESCLLNLRLIRTRRGEQATCQDSHSAKEHPPPTIEADPPGQSATPPTGDTPGSARTL